MVELLSTVGLAILAASLWVIVTAFATRVQMAFQKLRDSRTEEEWAWMGLPIGGGILVFAFIIHIGLSVVGTAEQCHVVKQDATQLLELPTEVCSAASSR